MPEAFEQAARDAQQLATRPDNASLLQRYALDKQATEGDAKGERPAGFDFVKAAKEGARAGLRGTSPEDARARHVTLVTLVGRLKGEGR